MIPQVEARLSASAPPHPMQDVRRETNDPPLPSCTLGDKATTRSITMPQVAVLVFPFHRAER